MVEADLTFCGIGDFFFKVDSQTDADEPFFQGEVISALNEGIIGVHSCIKPHLRQGAQSRCSDFCVVVSVLFKNVEPGLGFCCQVICQRIDFVSAVYDNRPFVFLVVFNPVTGACALCFIVEIVGVASGSEAGSRCFVGGVGELCSAHGEIVEYSPAFGVAQTHSS